MVRKINLGGGKTATALGEEGYGIDDIVVEREKYKTKSGYGDKDLWDIARDAGVSDPSQVIRHRMREAPADATFGANEEKPKIRVFVDSKGVIQRAEVIESDERPVRPISEYRSDFTEEVFTGIAAPYVNQTGLTFTASDPTDWNLGAFSHAILGSSLRTVSVPVPHSVFEIIDIAEGNADDKTSFYAGAGTANAPLRPIALQESTGVICGSLHCTFEADQAGLDAILDIFETGAGFVEGPGETNVEFHGIKWAGMMQFDTDQKITAILPVGPEQTISIEIDQLLDPRSVELDGATPISNAKCFCRLFLTYLKDGNLSTAKWTASIVRFK